MKYNLSSTILICYFFFTVTLFAQKRKNYNVNVQKPAKVNYRISTQMTTIIPARKIMMRDNKIVWVFPTNTIKGHYTSVKVGEKEKFTKKIKEGDSLYALKFKEYKAYKEASRYSKEIPNKAFEIGKFEEHPNWITSKERKFDLKGAVGKINIYYHNSMDLIRMSFAGYNMYDLPETNKENTDHIVVTDTLLVGPSCLGFMNLQRKNRGYIKIIANCIIYERPIKVSSTMISNKTDFVFSAKEIFLKSPYKDLSNIELNNPSPPFILKVDTNVEAYIDPFQKNEILLLNRLMINKLSLTYTELQNPNTDYWAKDKLLAKFQTLRGRVNIEALNNDDEYLTLFNNLCDNFETKYASPIIESDRSKGELSILVEGNIGDLPKVPFKYYAIPTKATLLPVKNHVTGLQDKLGDLYYKATGDSKMSLTLQVKLGYDAIKFDKVNQELIGKGVVLENNPPKTVMSISEQPLKAKGRTIGRIIPISNQILRFEIDLQEEGLDIIKIFLKDDNIFDLDYKIYQGQKEGNQKISLEIPEEILKQLDFKKLRNEFNIIESYTITDAVIITSNLSPFLEDIGEGTLDYGALDYIEISLEFLFENKTVFRGPKRYSSHSVHGSEEEIKFMKYSDNYTIKVTGTAYYEFGHRDIIKDNSFTNTKYIMLQESMFKNNSLKN